MTHHELMADLQSFAHPEKAAFFPKFFKTGPGQYGEGDQFIGISVPNQRLVAKKYKELSLKELQKLLYSPIHEHRLTALLILVKQFEKADLKQQEQIYLFYLKHKAQVNNWDLVDSSAHKIVGAYLMNKDRALLYELSQSSSLWDRRIAMISCFAFLRIGDFDDTLKVAELLLHDKHDLIHKAVGWVLRELGKKDLKILEEFLRRDAQFGRRYYQTMPRTMLRYAIEKFPPEKRAFYMGKV